MTLNKDRVVKVLIMIRMNNSLKRCKRDIRIDLDPLVMACVCAWFRSVGYLLIITVLQENFPPTGIRRFLSLNTSPRT